MQCTPVEGATPAAASSGSCSGPPPSSQRPGPEIIEISDGEDDAAEAAPDNLLRPRAQRQRPKLRVIFPAEVPRHIVRLIQAYQQANNCTAVPPEIYCIQSHRVYSIPLTRAQVNANNQDHDRPGPGPNTGKQRYEYIHTPTGQRLHIRAFILPWMQKETPPKCSERLLVASGPPLPEPVVLARTQPYIKDFRAWGGVDDDKHAQGIVVRKVVPVQKAVPVQKHAEVNVGHGTNGRDDDVVVLGSRTVNAGQPKVDPRLGYKTARTDFHFQNAKGEVVRVRTAAQLVNMHGFVRNAIAAGAVDAQEWQAVLECRITLTTDVVERLVVADSADFEVLVKLVLDERNWIGPRDRCSVVVSKLR